MISLPIVHEDKSAVSDLAGFFFNSYNVYRPAALSYVFPIVSRSASQADHVLVEDVSIPILIGCLGSSWLAATRVDASWYWLGPWFAPREEWPPRPAAWETNHWYGGCIWLYPVRSSIFYRRITFKD